MGIMIMTTDDVGSLSLCTVACTLLSPLPVPLCPRQRGPEVPPVYVLQDPVHL
jgi:hypothetical protein